MSTVSPQDPRHNEDLIDQTMLIITWALLSIMTTTFPLSLVVKKVKWCHLAPVTPVSHHPQWIPGAQFNSSIHGLLRMATTEFYKDAGICFNKAFLKALTKGVSSEPSQVIISGWLSSSYIINPLQRSSSLFSVHLSFTQCEMDLWKGGFQVLLERKQRVS